MCHNEKIYVLYFWLQIELFFIGNCTIFTLLSFDFSIFAMFLCMLLFIRCSISFLLFFVHFHSIMCYSLYNCKIAKIDASTKWSQLDNKTIEIIFMNWIKCIKRKWKTKNLLEIFLSYHWLQLNYKFINIPLLFLQKRRKRKTIIK